MATHRSYVCSCFAMFFNSAFYSNHVLPSSRSRFVSLDMYYPSVVAIVCGSGPWLCPSVLDLLSSSSPNGFFSTPAMKVHRVCPSDQAGSFSGCRKAPRQLCLSWNNRNSNLQKMDIMETCTSLPIFAFCQISKTEQLIHFFNLPFHSPP